MSARRAPARGTSGSTCGVCRLKNRPEAAYCRACGASLQGQPDRLKVRPVMAAATVSCAKCRGVNRPEAAFCRHCGSRVQPAAPAPVARPQPQRPLLTGDDVVRNIRMVAARASALRGTASLPAHGVGGLVAGAGMILLGSFLPLASSGAIGQSFALIPDAAEHVGSVYLVPLAGVVLVALALLMPQMALPLRSLSAGVCIALASPGLLMTWTFIRVGNSLAGSFLGSLAQGSVGVGAGALLLGFLVALVGGFVVLWQTHDAAAEEHAS